MSNTFYAELGEATVALLKAKMSLHNEKVKGNIISKHLRAIANCLVLQPQFTNLQFFRRK